MARRIGPTTPRRLIRFGNGPNASIPRASGTYTSADGAIIVPSGALDRWFDWRFNPVGRRDLVGFGDSTWYGSGGNYSIFQRIRDRAVGFGLPDGGKGMFAGAENLITYDSPEVNGFVSTTFDGVADGFDNLTGNYFYDPGTIGHNVVAQFRSTALRLWYSDRGGAGPFSYVVKDAGNNTVASGSVTPAGSSLSSRFVYISGLAAGATYTITVTVLSAAPVWVAFAPVNATGLAVQKQAVSGGTFTNFFFGGLLGTSPYTWTQVGMRYQTPLGLLPTAVSGGSAYNYSGATVDTSYADAARVNPILAMGGLGFNDLSEAAGTPLAAWTEYVRKFAAACRAASCDGIICSGQLPYNANWPAYGAARFNALKSEALNQGLAFVDLFYPIGGPSLSYAGGTTSPHRTRVEYTAQADYLVDSLLGLAA